MNSNLIDNSLESILEHYRKAFSVKAFDDKFLDEDDLMLVFGLTQEIKSQNKQYRGRELGMCWQRIVIELCKHKCSNFNDSIKEGSDEFCDLIVGNDAIDTKYRIGSGDSGTLKKFKQYGRELQKRGYNPVLLILLDILPVPKGRGFWYQRQQLGLPSLTLSTPRVDAPTHESIRFRLCFGSLGLAEMQCGFYPCFCSSVTRRNEICSSVTRRNEKSKHRKH